MADNDFFRAGVFDTGMDNKAEAAMRGYKLPQDSCVAELLVDRIKRATEFRTYLTRRIEEIEKEQADITHEMERNRCLHKERSRLATRLAALLRERRQAKDFLKAYRPLYDYLDSDKGKNLINWLSGFIGDARKAEKAYKRVLLGIVENE